MQSILDYRSIEHHMYYIYLVWSCTSPLTIALLSTGHTLVHVHTPHTHIHTQTDRYTLTSLHTHIYIHKTIEKEQKFEFAHELHDGSELIQNVKLIQNNGTGSKQIHAHNLFALHKSRFQTTRYWGRTSLTPHGFANCTKMLTHHVHYHQSQFYSIIATHPRYHCPHVLLKKDFLIFL